MRGVVAQQVGVGLDRAEIIDADDLDIVALCFCDGTQHVAADPAKSVDRYPDSHVRSRLSMVTPAQSIRRPHK